MIEGARICSRSFSVVLSGKRAAPGASPLRRVVMARQAGDAKIQAGGIFQVTDIFRNSSLFKEGNRAKLGISSLKYCRYTINFVQEFVVTFPGQVRISSHFDRSGVAILRQARDDFVAHM